MQESQPFDQAYTMTIDGVGVGAAASIEVINPASEALVSTAPDSSHADLDAAVAAARAALPGWRKVAISDRRKAILAIADCLEKNIESLSELFTAEQGKPLNAAREEIVYSAGWLRAVAHQDIPIEIVEDTPERTVEVRRVSVGVVGAIVPWNFPILLAIWKLAPALLTGNTVIWKPSPFTPLTTLKIGELLRPILPPGVVNVLTGGDKLGPWMTSHPGIDKISFTGSSATGVKVLQSTSETLKSVTLELGGNDACIVLPDVDVQAAAGQIFWASFLNSGQLCVASKRVYVHADIYDQFAQVLAAIASQVRVGSGVEEGVLLGPIQNRPQYERVCGLLDDCRNRGYTFLSGGQPEEGPGFFIPVTIVDNPPDDSRVVREEAFGPVLPLLKFTDVDDVIARANSLEYGLAGSVWSRDVDAARAIAERLDTGLVWINDILYQSPFAAFGGRKLSGFGVENGREGLLSFTYPQTLIVAKQSPSEAVTA